MVVAIASVNPRRCIKIFNMDEIIKEALDYITPKKVDEATLEAAKKAKSSSSSSPLAGKSLMGAENCRRSEGTTGPAMSSKTKVWLVSFIVNYFLFKSILAWCA